MPGKSSKKKRLWRFWDSGPRFQTLFDEGRPQEPQGFWSNVDPEVLRHPIRFLTEEWRAPRTRPSLFHYVEDPESRRAEHVSVRFAGRWLPPILRFSNTVMSPNSSRFSGHRTTPDLAI